MQVYEDTRTPWEIFLGNNEISDEVAADLTEVLSSTKLVLLLDDSGSMATKVVEPGSAAQQAVGGPQATRWSELEKLASTLVDMLIAAPTAHPVDIHFLNRGTVIDLKDRAPIADMFRTGPRGGTPIRMKMDQLCSRYGFTTKTKRNIPTLIIVITDGEPSDGSVDQLFQTLQRDLTRFPSIHISFAECNDNEEEMAYLDGWDTKLPRFDNTDDFPMEALRIRTRQKAMGQRQKFTYVDYVNKIILGSMNRKYFNMDQMPPQPPNFEQTISKRGRIMRNWKSRRFVLCAGDMNYYCGSSSGRKKGTVYNIQSYAFDTTTQLLNVEGLTSIGFSRSIALRFESESDMMTWTKAMDRHIAWNLLQRWQQEEAARERERAEREA